MSKILKMHSTSAKMRSAWLILMFLWIGVSEAGKERLTIDGGQQRPANVFLPGSYTSAHTTRAFPLLFLLHAYEGSSTQFEENIDIFKAADGLGFVLIIPNGTVDSLGNRFWSAPGMGCCNFFNSTVNDTAYLVALIDQAERSFNIDPKRIFFSGASNGAFMTYAMACAYSERIAGVVAISGGMYQHECLCRPSSPVSVLTVHGTSDETISYKGGSLNEVDYAGALLSSQLWANIDQCSNSTATAPFQFSDEIATTLTFHCPRGVDVILWTVEGGTHFPSAAFTEPTIRKMLDFLLHHPKVHRHLLRNPPCSQSLVKRCVLGSNATGTLYFPAEASEM